MNKKRKLLDGIVLLGGTTALYFVALFGVLMVISRILIIFDRGVCGDAAIRMAFGLVAVAGGLIGAKYWDMYWREKNE